VSGHVFMLVLATSMLAFEAFGAMRAVPLVEEGKKVDGEVPGKKADGEVAGQSEGESVQVQSDGDWMRTWSLRLVGAVVVVGWWMLFMTSIWFHTWLEKVCFLTRDERSRIANGVVDWAADCAWDDLRSLHPAVESAVLERYCWNSWNLGTAYVACCMLDFVYDLCTSKTSFSSFLHRIGVYTLNAPVLPHLLLWTLWLRTQIPASKGCICQFLHVFSDCCHSPPGINAAAYMIRVMGRRSSGVTSVARDSSMYGSQAAMMASAYTLRSTERSFSVVCSAWHWMPIAVPNSRNASRYLILRSR
jgi:hypothetical protein